MSEGENGTPTSTVEVDPEALRAFAGRLETEAGEIEALHTAGVFEAAAEALPGTGFAAPAQRAADLTAAAVQRIAARLTTVAEQLRDDAGRYEMTETEFSTALATVGLDIPA